MVHIIPASQVGVQQLSRIPSACLHGPAVCAHNDTRTSTRQVEVAAQQPCGCVVVPNSHLPICVSSYDRPRMGSSTACCSNKAHSGITAGSTPGPAHSRHLTSNVYQAVHHHHSQQQQQQQHTVAQLLLDHQQRQGQPQQPAAAVRNGLQQVAAGQQRLLDFLVDATEDSSSNDGLQQQQVVAAWVTQWCCCMQPYLQHLPLPALATVAVCLDIQQKQQQQQQQQEAVGQHKTTAQQYELASGISLMNAEFLHAYCLAAEAAAAASSATCSTPVVYESAWQQQWTRAQRLRQRQGGRGQHHQNDNKHQHQQQLEAMSAIISWATQQLIQQQRHHWQQGRQQQQHAQQVQLHLQVRSHLLQVLQVAISSRLLPSATPQILQELLMCYGRLGVPVDETRMGRWLAAARHVMSDVTVPFRAQQGSGSDVQWQRQQQQLAAAVYCDLTGLLHSLAAAKVKPPESWLSVWQDAAVLVIQHKPDFTNDNKPITAAAAAATAHAVAGDAGFLTSLQQLLHAVSYLKLQLSAEYWNTHEGLVQQQLLQYRPHQLLLLLQLHQQHQLKPSPVCVKYMAAQLEQHIHNMWQQQQQQQGLCSGSCINGGQVLAVCMCVCGLAAWGVRLTITATCELLVCLAAHHQLLPLPWLIQVLFTLGPRMGLSTTRATGRDSSSSSSLEQGCQAQHPPAATASAAAAAAVLELLEYAAQHLAASRQQWQQPSRSAAAGSSIRQLHQLLQLAAHLPRGKLRNTPLLSRLTALAASAAPMCQITDLIQIMTHWTHLGFSSAWRHGRLRRGYKRLGQPSVLQALQNADLVAVAVAAAKLPVLQRVIWQLAGEISARLALTNHIATESVQHQMLGGAKLCKQQQQGFTAGQLVEVVSAVPALAVYWPPDQVLLLLQHIEGLEQQHLLNPADQWRVWSALQQLQQHWRPAVAAVAATATAQAGVPATKRSSSSSSNSSSDAVPPVHVNLQSSIEPHPYQQPAVGAAAGDASSSTLDQEYHRQQRQHQQELVSLLERVQQQVAAALSNAAPVVLPVYAAPAVITPAVRKIHQTFTNTSHIIPSAWVHEQQQHQGQLTVEQLLQHLAQAQRALQSTKSAPADITRVCEGLARLLAVPRFSRALSKVPAARDGVLRALEAAAWPDLDAKTLDGHQLLLLTRVCDALGVSEDRPYMQKVTQSCVETLTTLPAKDLAAVLGRSAAVHMSGFCKCWEVVLLRLWVGRVQQLAVQNPEDTVGVLVPLVRLGFKPAPAAAALVLLPLLSTTAAAAAAATATAINSSSTNQQNCEALGEVTVTSAGYSSSTSDHLQSQQQQGANAHGLPSASSPLESSVIPLSVSAAAAAATGVGGGEAAGSDGAKQQAQGLSAKGLVLLTRLLVDLKLRPDPSTADLLLSCQINCMRSCNTTQLLQLAHCNLQLGLLGGPIRGLGVWSGQGDLPGRVLIWVRTWLSWINRSFKISSTSQAVEAVLLSTEIELLPVYRTTQSSQAIQDICRLQQQLHAAAASAASTSSSSTLHGLHSALAAAAQASYLANRADRRAAAAAVARKTRRHLTTAAAAAGGGGGGGGSAADLDSDDEYSSRSNSSTTSSSGDGICVGAASSSSHSRVMARRSAIAAASAASSHAGFSYYSHPKTLLLYQLQQQRCALLWAAVKFRLVTPDLPWVTKCLSAFESRLDCLPPALVMGLLNAATEASTSSSSSSSTDGDVVQVQPSPMMHLAFNRLCSRVSAQLLEQVLTSCVSTDLLAAAVSSLAAYVTATQVRRQQQQHWWSAGQQPAGFGLTHQQRRRLQIVILRQLPYLQAEQLSGLLRAMATLPVRPRESTVQPETVRPSPHFLARACQVLGKRATSAGAAGQPTQQLLLLTAARQLMALQPVNVIGSAAAAAGAARDASAPMTRVQGTVSASSSSKPVAQQSTQTNSDAELSPVVPLSSRQVPRSVPAGVGQLVTRTLGAAGLQVLASLVQRLKGNTQPQQQKRQQQVPKHQQSSTVGTTLSGVAAQMMAWSKAVQRQQQQRTVPTATEAKNAGYMSAATQQQQLANITAVLGMAGVSGSSKVSGSEQQQQHGLSGPGQQQLLGMLLRLELQQALKPQLAAAAQGCENGAAAVAADCSNQLAPTTPVDVARAPRHVAARGLQLKFDGLLRWAFKAAAVAAAAATTAGTDLDSSSSSKIGGMMAERTPARPADPSGADTNSSRRSSSNSDSSNGDSIVVVLPVMSRALDAQFARLLRQVLQHNMAPHGRTD